MRLAGIDYFIIKQASGAKTDSAFQRYNLVTEEEMKSIKWLDEKGEKSGTIDTYMDTIAKTKIVWSSLSIWLLMVLPPRLERGARD